MRVLFLIPHPEEAASGRFRVFQYVPWLRAHGVRCEIRPFMSRALYRVLYQPGKLPRKVAMSAAALLRRFADLVRAARVDVVVVHREALPVGTPVLEAWLRRLCPALVFDFDDAIYLNPVSAANAWTRAFKRGDKTARIIALSSYVIAGNRVLEAYAKRYNPRVSVLPTPVDTACYTPRTEPPRAGTVVIGWMGSHTTADYLSALARPLAEVMRRYPHVSLRVVGASRVPFQWPRVQAVQWRIEREVDELRRLDIGVMPMPDTDWTRGKCGFKALLYMSVGIPVIASPVGINSDIVRDGVNGFLATTESQWIERLSQLIEDARMRTRMGGAGRAIVEQEYSLHVSAPRLLGVLERAQAEGARPRSVRQRAMAEASRE